MIKNFIVIIGEYYIKYMYNNVIIYVVCYKYMCICMCY